MGWIDDILINPIFGGNDATQDELNHPYAYFKHKLINADSEPDLDEWGIDAYWSAANWVYWFNRNVDKYGKLVAKTKWDKYARENSYGSSFYSWANVDDEFLKFVKTNGLYYGEGTITQNLHPSGALANLINAGTNLTEFVDDETEQISNESSTSSVSWLKVVMIFVGVWLLIKLLGVLAYYRPIRSNNKYSPNKRLRR